MSWETSIISYMYILTGTVTLVTAWINWRRREQPGVALLAGAMLAMSLWAFFNAVEAISIGTALKLAWVILENLAAGAFIVWMFLFVIDYTGMARWLRHSRRWILWVPVAAYLVLELTNPWHHLVWTGFLPGPAGSNLLLYEHGSLYYFSLGFACLLVVLTLAVLGHAAYTSRGWERRRALWMGVSLAAPLAASLVYAAASNQPQSVNALPIGAALCSLLISWIVIEDLQVRMAERTDELSTTIRALEAEVTKRERLESDLRDSTDLLAQRLADQSQKLAGLYDLILISSHSANVQEVLEHSLEKIASLTESDAVCFYHLAPEALRLEAHHGLAPAVEAGMAALPYGWLSEERDVRADIDTTVPSDLPAGIAAAGFGACLCKPVYARDRALGMLGAFWQARRSFSVGEIALFGALTDELGVITENARLRQEATDAAAYQERRRLARELHDSVTQSLHSLVISSETAGQLLHTKPERLEKTLEHLAASARQALREMRLLLYELRLVPLEEIHFVDAIRNRLDAVERRANVDVIVEIDRQAVWPKAWEVELYPMAMEALNNSLKHSGASRVEVHVWGGQGNFELGILDNGHGFDPANVRPGGMGLQTMRERAERLKGRLEVCSAAGQGTQIWLRIGPGRGAKTMEAAGDGHAENPRSGG